MALRNLATFGRRIFEFSLSKTQNNFVLSSRSLKQGTYIFYTISRSANIIVFGLVVQTEAPDGTLVISGTHVPSTRIPHLVKVDDSHGCKACYMCNLNLDVKHTVRLH